MKQTTFKGQILVPLTLAFVILLGAFVINDYKNQQKVFSRDIERGLGVVQELYEKQLTSETELLITILEMISLDVRLQNAWEAKDREALFVQSSPLLKELGSNHRITHFYFHQLDQTNFLRVYDSERFGDKIDRFTLKEAVKTGKDSSGVELGKLGTMTLRVVHPWRINGTVVGYIEMGEEIDHIIEKLHDILDVELYVSIYKEFLDQEKWEAGRRIQGHSNNWDLLPTVVIVGQTLKKIPEPFKNFLKHGRHEYMEMATDLEITIGAKTYRVGVIPLDNAENIEIGDIIILSDVTFQLSSFDKNILLTGSIYAVIGLLLFIFFSTYLRKLESTISGYQNNLEEMVTERTEELSAALDEIRTLRGIIPICSYCNKIRDNDGRWNQMEIYVSKHSYAEFSHGACPNCFKEHFSKHIE